uniref:Uncharacterized protein n=1 Tax=Rhizophora mucronata TaxID=61149 RepID=A0A2P2MTK0_RHIMU
MCKTGDDLHVYQGKSCLSLSKISHVFVYKKIKNRTVVSVLNRDTIVSH